MAPPGLLARTKRSAPQFRFKWCAGQLHLVLDPIGDKNVVSQHLKNVVSSPNSLLKHTTPGTTIICLWARPQLNRVCHVFWKKTFLMAPPGLLARAKRSALQFCFMWCAGQLPIVFSRPDWWQKRCLPKTQTCCLELRFTLETRKTLDNLRKQYLPSNASENLIKAIFLETWEALNFLSMHGHAGLPLAVRNPEKGKVLDFLSMHEHAR